MITLQIKKDEQNMISRALRVLADEHITLSEQCHSKVLKQGFVDDAERLLRLAMDVEAVRDLPVNTDEECLRLIRQGQFINAIKLRRERTSEGLYDAKMYCEKLRDGIKPQD